MAKQAAVSGEIVNEEIFKLSTGVRVSFKPVSSMIIQRAHESVPMPNVFVQAVAGPNNTQRFVDNPNHPVYLELKAAAENQRGMKAIEAMVLMGVNLVDGLPKSDEWLQDLDVVTDLSKYWTIDADGNRVMSDKVKKMLYVMNVAASTADDFTLISDNVIVREERVAEVVNTF
jgi:hypothetical protein